MSRKSVLALPLVGALMLLLTGSVLAEPPCQPRPEQPRTHTMTIINGSHVMQRTFVLRNDSWRSCEDSQQYDVFVRDCPRSPWQLQGTYCSSRRAEEVACSLRNRGNQVSVRHHCP